MIQFDLLLYHKHKIGDLLFTDLIESIKSSLEQQSSDTENIRRYVQSVVKTCRTNKKLKKDQNLQEKIITINKLIPQLDILSKQSSPYRWIFGGGIVALIITTIIHKKYGLQTMPSRLHSLFKK